VGTLTGLYVTGNVSASFFEGQGNALTNVLSSVLVGNVASANVALVVSQPLQPNITQVGTLTGLYVTGNVTASFFNGEGNGLTNVLSSVLVGNVASANLALVVTGALQPNITQVGTLTGLFSSGNVTASFFSGQGNALSNIQSAALVGNVASANTALVVTQPAQPNVTSLGTLTGLSVQGLLSASNGSGIANLTAAAITGNVAQANVALVVSQAAQPNVTSLGTLTGLTVQGLLSASNGSGIANLTAAAITGNVAQANIALVVSQPAQPNITSLGTLTGLSVQGLLSASNGSGIANLTAASITGNVAQANVALVVSQAAQPNVTSLGTLTGLSVQGLLSASNGSGIANLTAASITGNVARANVALVVSQPYQPNITSLDDLTVNNNLSVTGNIVPVTLGNTYVTGNLVVSGNVFSALGTPLGFGGSLYFSLGGTYAPPTYTGILYGTTLAPNLSPFSVQGSSSAVTRTVGGYLQFSRTGVYNLRGVFCTTGDNITGVAIGSNVAEVHGTDQTYVYRHVPFVSQNPTAVFDIDFYVGSVSAYYYVDLFAVDAPTLQPTSNTLGGTWFTVGPSSGLGGSGGSVTMTTLGNCVFNASPGASDYYVGVSNGTTVTLPLGASLSAGKQYIIKDESGLAGTFVGYRVTVAASGPDLIDGQASFVVALNYGAVNVIWTGSSWRIF